MAERCFLLVFFNGLPPLEMDFMKIMMKLKKNVFLYVALGAMLGGCSEEKNELPGTNEGENVRLTFNIAQPGSFELQTAGSVNENGGADDKIAFYQFDINGKYEQRYILNCADGVLSEEGDRAYSLELTSSTTGEKKFVIVECKDESAFPSMVEGEDMNELLYAETGEDGILQPPFVMSNARNGESPCVIVNDVEATDNQVNVTLKRRVARFDLLNDPEISGVSIDKVYVKNRRVHTFVGDVDGVAGDVAADVLEIPASALANEGISFYLYPTQLTAMVEQAEKTVIWATTRLAGSDAEGPTLYLNLKSDLDVEANCLYRLDTKNIAGSAGFDVSVEEWQDGTSVDWVTVEEDGISVPDENAVIMEGTEIKGTYVKILPEAVVPYTVSRIVTDMNEADLQILYDGNLPAWLEVSSSTVSVGNGYYRHELCYTVTDIPDSEWQFAVTYLNGQVTDENLLVIGFANPYPGTPLPCLSWGDKIYSPTHVRQSTYLTHNNVDKAYFCGAEGYTFNTDMKGIKNDVAVDPCPEGWHALNDDEAEDFIRWVGEHLNSKVVTSVYTYNWFDVAGEGTDLRFLAGYPKSGSPTAKDLAVWGTWPHAAWVNITESNLSISDETFGDDWSINGDYGLLTVAFAIKKDGNDDVCCFCFLIFNE